LWVEEIEEIDEVEEVDASKGCFRGFSEARDK
jgi:hypothetical protein